jgi:protein-tyrosine-phosphatase
MNNPSALQRILFLSTENSARSQMAEAFARIHGDGMVEAFSAGDQPSGRIHPRAILFMDEKDYDLSSHVSRSLDDLPPGEYAAVITLGRASLGATLQARIHENWDVDDPKYLSPAEFRAVRDLIERKVKDLLARI